MSDKKERPIIGLTVGDPAGIGPEIVIKALQNDATHASIRPVVYADRAILEQTLEMLGVDLELNVVENPTDGRFEKGCVDFVDCGILDGSIAYGEISADGGRAGYGYLNRAIDDALSGDVVGLATAPLNKESLQAAKVP
ncbi:MAG: 4-hydroxythreonine-4-phosphate dehydrogenase PdxA, partial [Candidatus Latescibacterota bacterium]